MKERGRSSGGRGETRGKFLSCDLGNQKSRNLLVIEGLGEGTPCDKVERLYVFCIGRRGMRRRLAWRSLGQGRGGKVNIYQSDEENTTTKKHPFVETGKMVFNYS